VKLLSIFVLLTISTTTIYAKDVSSRYSVEAFFNHSEKYSYTDPYRKIKRKGQNLEKVVIDSIRSAKKTIYLAVQELRLPLVALELIKKKQEGVDVRIVMENSYNHTSEIPMGSLFMKSRHGDTDENEHDAARYAELRALVDVNQDGVLSEDELLSRDSVYMLRASGLKVKDDTADGSYGSGLMHHKFMVIDSKELVISSANFTLSGIHGDILDRKTRGNANSMLKIKSPSLAKTFTEEFMQMWGGKYGSKQPRFGPGKTYRGMSKTSVKNSKVYSQFSPTPRGLGFDASVNGTIAKFLKTAKKEVLIALFVFSDQEIVNALNTKREKNNDLDINVLIERKFATRNYSELLDMWGMQIRDDHCGFEYKNNPWKTPLKSAGVPNLSEGDMLHHKFAVIDEETVIVGSQNWSDSANHLNDENILVIKDSHIAKLYAEEFHRLNKYAQLGPSSYLIRKMEVLEQRCTSSY